VCYEVTDVAQVPGMAKALTKLQNTGDSETQQRAWLALSMLKQEKGGEDVSVLEKKLMDTGDKKMASRPAQQAQNPEDKPSKTMPSAAAPLEGIEGKVNTHHVSTPPVELEDLEFSKIDLFSPAMPHVSPKLNVEASLILPCVAPPVQQRLAGFPAQSTPPQQSGSSSARLQQPYKQAPDSWKIRKVADSASDRAVDCILTSPDPAHIVDAIQLLRANIQSADVRRDAQDDIGSDARLFLVFVRLLSKRHQLHTMHREVLSLLRELCSNHADNTAKLCRHESVLVALLGFSLRTADREAGTEALIAAELLSFCMLDDANFERLALARSSWKLGMTDGRNDMTATRQHKRSPRPNGSSSAGVRHSANYSARQAIISQEYAA
jgi:hypothetical protein